ncbi:MAG: polysaccharide pyruvyl transferase family protein [Eubacteriales bacterium]|nr:polysaccharide pyruvyl transferase family protein [Eubacteriales bacterium]
MNRAEKKTAIVSCYFQPNYGSMLQALATQMALDRLGLDNETICVEGLQGTIRQRKLLYFTKAALTSDILLSKAGMASARLRRMIPGSTYRKMLQARRKAFQEFRDRYFRLSDCCSTREELQKACAEKYSAVLVGSDQLWLPANIAADYYTLSFVPEGINTIAYATSFGQSDLPRDIRKKAAGFLPAIRHISVREKSGQRLVKKLCGRRVPIVADPTLLFTGEEWDCALRDGPAAEGRYIFCYFLGNNPEHREFASRLSGATGARIIALTHVDEYVRSDNGYADEAPWDTGPSEFLDLIRNAEWVCTDSYHCTVFSMLFRRRFFTFRRYSRKTIQSTNSRLDTLLEQCGLTDRILTGTEDISVCKSRVIDYSAVYRRIDKLRKYSWQYLRDALEDKKKTDLV